MSELVSPNDMLAAAKNMMLDGKEPSTHDDWMLIANFFAVNIHPDVVDSAMPVMIMLYDMPITREEGQQIIDFQRARNFGRT